MAHAGRSEIAEQQADGSEQARTDGWRRSKWLAIAELLAVA